MSKDKSWDERCDRVRRVVDEAITDFAMAGLADWMGGDAQQLGYAGYDRLEQLPIEDLSLAVAVLCQDTGLTQQRFDRLRRQVRELTG